MQSVRVLEDPRAVQAIAEPARVRLLDLLRKPDSAAGAARALGEPRQRVNYHLKELERAGLVERAGERRKGNFVEQLYQASAGRFVVSSKVGWDPVRLAGALRDQGALAHLVGLGERLQRDAAVLLDRAAFAGEQIASAAVEAEVAFADAAAREAFMHDYLALLGPLLARHGAAAGAPFRAALAVYPEPAANMGENT